MILKCQTSKCFSHNVVDVSTAVKLWIFQTTWTFWIFRRLSWNIVDLSYLVQFQSTASESWVRQNMTSCSKVTWFLSVKLPLHPHLDFPPLNQTISLLWTTRKSFHALILTSTTIKKNENLKQFPLVKSNFTLFWEWLPC